MMVRSEIRYALRTFRKSPAVTIAAGATLALGIGANTAMFSILQTELLRALPFRDSGRLVRVAERNDSLIGVRPL